MYHAGVRFDYGDLVEIAKRAYIYLGEDYDGYSVFCHFDERGDYEIKRLNVEWNSPTIVEPLRIPRLSSIRESTG